MRSTMAPSSSRASRSATRRPQAMLEARLDDGRFGPSPVGAQHRRRTLVAALNERRPLPADPRPDAMGRRGDAVPHPELIAVPAPPPALESAQYAEEFDEVKSLGRATGSTRTDDQTYFAKWWQSAPVLSWNEVARQLIARTGLDAADSARLLAMQNLIGADAAINCWNDKYHYDFWRPWNAIARAAEDDNLHDDPTRPGRRSSPRRIRSGPRATTASMPHTSRSCGCSSGTRPRGASRSRARRPSLSPTERRCGGSTPSPSRSPSSSTRASGPACISAPPTWQGQALGRNVAAYGVANYFQPVGH